MSPRRIALVPTSLAIVALAAAACSGTQPGAADVQVDLNEFTLGLSASTTSAGRVRFAITNRGAAIHEVEVFTLPSGVDPDKLAIKENVADTEAAGMSALDEVEDIAPLTSTTLGVDLQPGRYLLICNLPAHYQGGMHAMLTVN
jgi:uncharacterized cupredoxin-like copper-binding protein